MKFQGIAEFAAKRRTDQDDLEKSLYPHVAEAMKAFPAVDWYNDLLREVGRAYSDVFHREGGTGEPRPSVADFVSDVRSTLDKTEDPDTTTVDRVSVWLSTAILNAGTMAAADDDEEFVVMEWVTMHDDDVRDTHEDVEGQQRPPGDMFDVGGEKMPYPGFAGVSIELWINCRCSLAPVLGEDALVATSRLLSKHQEATMTATAETEREQGVDVSTVTPLPWFGVLAPEGVWSGDGRKFADGALCHRDLPLPLTWQKSSGNGHDGSVTVAKIENIARVDGQMRGSGHFVTSPESDEVVGLIAEFGKFGVSVDADDAEFEYDEETNKVEFTSARISSASIVAIPAFHEAFVAIGEAPPDFMPKGDKDTTEEEVEDVCDEESPAYDEKACEEQRRAETEEELASEGSWDGSASRFTDEQWKASCVLHLADTLNKSDHKLPIKEPGGALSRAGVHAAASRFNQVDAPAEAKARAKASLRGAYKTLGEEVPDVLKASVLMDSSFGRGPGWITNPGDTKRIHDYWTKKGQEGYNKINWGVPGDFNRCRLLVGEKIAKNSPEDMVYLNNICAQWHYDALGWWPGRPTSGETEDFDTEQIAEFVRVNSALGLPNRELDTTPAPGLSIVAAGGHCAPSEWFQDPQFTEVMPLTVTDEGRVFGHVAGWKTCHTAYRDMCVAPPHSNSDYAYFLTGYVQTDAGPVRTGPLTIGTGHAKPGGMRGAMAHYDNTGSAVADVTCGEDEHGIWYAGWIRPGVTDEQIAALRASPLSGDWRKIDPYSDDYEMIAALAVNSGGFPIPRVGVEHGQQVSLVAAGVVEPLHGDDGIVEALVDKVIEELGARDKRKQRMAELAARVGV